MSSPHVTVRMYKGLLGDCFLLRLFRDDGSNRTRKADSHILIDCGVIQRAPSEAKLMARVVDDLMKIGTLNLVVVTHEHYDHICGFEGLLRKGIEIEMLWLAWTEDLECGLAKKLRKMQDEVRMAVGAGMQQMAVSSKRRPTGRDKVREWTLDGDAMGLDTFIGPFDANGSDRMTSRDILEGLKNAAKETEYRRPGEVISLSFERNIRAFVLGPPQNITRLMKDRPSSSPKNRETYLDARTNEANLVTRSFLGASETSGNSDQEGTPFSRPYCKITDAILLADALPEPPQDLPWARNVWEVWQKYRSTPEDIRIDDDWHNPIGNLALKLDSDTNNTSLVLAFELGADGDVLLFAADAQVGNWLSWHDQKYPSGKDIHNDIGIPASEILRRTVLYKVGHHGSHNATLSKEGLEQIKGKNLVAMLPVVQEVADRRGWKMPFDKMFNRLKELTDDRILRGDEPLSEGLIAKIKAFGKDVREPPDDEAGLGPLWVEYDVS